MNPKEESGGGCQESLRAGGICVRLRSQHEEGYIGVGTDSESFQPKEQPSSIAQGDGHS